MPSTPSRLHYLFEKYKDNVCTGAELQEFWLLIADLPDSDLLSPEMKTLWEETQAGNDTVAEAGRIRVLNKILRPADAKNTDHRYYRRWHLWAAAAILAIVLAGSYLIFFIRPARELPVARVFNPNFRNDVAPGVTGATLRLGNGKEIRLDSTGAGPVAKQGGMDVVISHSSLQYEGAADTGTLIYNTLVTGRGQQFPVQLSDGSKVLLDAGSSLRYPVAFAGRDRTVEITGQAWFEVAKDARRPFYVNKGDQQLQVLGTQFNVDAYDDEDELKVTLTEGSLRIRSGQGSAMLRPGQQAVLAQSSGRIGIIEQANIEQAIAWKNGLFSYQGSTIEEVMRDAARWYDVSVVYREGKPGDTFTGEISRSASLTELLTILEMSRVHFKLEGRKLTVLPGKRN